MPKVLIIGAGIGGLTAAIALARTGHSVDVFERSAKIENIGGGIQQSPNAMAVWKALGLSGKVHAKSCEPKAGILRDYQSGKPLMVTMMKGVYEKRYGHKYLHIHRAELIQILIEAAHDVGVKIHVDHYCEEAQQIDDKINLIAGQRNYIGDILIGADGIKSILRPMIAGKSEPIFTKQVAWRGIVETNTLTPDLIPFAANNWLGPNRHFVSYYVKNGTQINFVAVEERDEWTAQGWRQKADKNALKAAFASWDPKVTQLIDACEESYLWGLFDHPPLNTWTNGRMTILGDAAHPMLPFMAQGAAMAVEDGWVLAHSLATHNSNVPEALTHYEKARKGRTERLQKISRGNAVLYHQKLGLGRTVRNIKFKIGTIFPSVVFNRLDKIYGVDVTQEFPIDF